MSAATRQLTAFVALGLAMILSAGCGAPRRTEVALAGSDSTSDEATSATSSPATAAVAGASSTADVTSPAPSTTVPAEQDDAAAFVAPSDSATSTGPTTTLRSAPKPRATTSTIDPDSQQLDEVDAALGREDICGVYAGLARFELVATSTDRLAAQLTRIKAIMVRATAFVAPSLAADWATVTDGTADMLASLEQDREISESAPSHYDDDRYRAASARVGDWMGRNCA